ncbi:6,7-dimethyl-8-ribityllumazine synthase [hydrothermal vent metagenome]|uniref:6,7-dimethyl-8-ribityllumazine synthase n=1 Tax=hydrothermal vent metagenome TaxID=652676 RepID=A0A3B1DR06_9ZZZZ
MEIQRWEGGMDATGLRFGIVVSRFNQAITDALLEGALKVLKQKGAADEDIDIASVPGAFEIPGVANQMGQLDRFEALICLGAVIQGETPHFDYICREVSRGIGQLPIELGIPVIFGVLTTSTVEQAIARAGGQNNKGAEAAMAAIEMAHLFQRLT